MVHIYDYLFTSVIIVGILLASTIMITSFTINPRTNSDIDQLKTASEKIMTQLLLDPGYPYEWGSAYTAPDGLQVFGLAKLGETSREAFTLDADKILRLNSATSFYVPPSIALNLLKITNDYGFTLEFNETLKVRASVIDSSDDSYSVTVTSEYNQPVTNAKVSAQLFYLNPTENTIAFTQPVDAATQYDGKCAIDFPETNLPVSARVLIIVVNYLGAQMTYTYPVPESGAIAAHLLGDSLISNQPYTVNPTGDAREIVLCEGDQGYWLRQFAVKNAGSLTQFKTSVQPEPSAIAVIVVTDTPAGLLVGFRDFSISYRSIPAIRSAALAYSVERTVLIGGSTYTVTLYFWRMSY